MKRLTTIFICATLTMAFFATFSCTSNKEIPDNLTAKELIQKGQESFEKSRQKDALRYFNAVIDRYGTDPALYIEARYEIGHIYMKKKNYEAAVPVLEELIDLYAHYPVGTFPPSYEKLAKLELAKIPENKLAEIHEKQREKEAALEKAQKSVDLQEELQQSPQDQNAETELPAESEKSEEPAASSDSNEAESSVSDPK
ncbi:MAG: tetratricopeptide repeat protein [Treponema sp.]|nr:tetratricopeptide repeat protein [Treponema sp.]